MGETIGGDCGDYTAGDEVRSCRDLIHRLFATTRDDDRRDREETPDDNGRDSAMKTKRSADYRKELHIAEPHPIRAGKVSRHADEDRKGEPKERIRGVPPQRRAEASYGHCRQYETVW